MNVGRINQLTTTPFIPNVQGLKTKQIDYDYIRVRTQQLLSTLVSVLSEEDIRNISICMEDVAENELKRT